MVIKADNTNNNCHIKALNIGTELVWRKFLFICNVKVETSQGRFWECFDMVYLLYGVSVSVLVLVLHCKCEI